MTVEARHKAEIWDPLSSCLSTASAKHRHRAETTSSLPVVHRGHYYRESTQRVPTTYTEGTDDDASTKEAGCKKCDASRAEASEKPPYPWNPPLRRTLGVTLAPEIRCDTNVTRFCISCFLLRHWPRVQPFARKITKNHSICKF